MTAAEKLRKIVAAAKGDDLERCQYGVDRGWYASIVALPDYRRERAEWQAASDLLERLLRETPEWAPW
jgi:hypothetical protein